jgi:hypothetical protein
MIDVTHFEHTPNTRIDETLRWGSPPHAPTRQADPEIRHCQTPASCSSPAADVPLKTTLARRMAPTEPLDENSPDIISILARFRSGFKIGAAGEYIPLPWHRRLRGVPPGACCWRIELHGLVPNDGPVGLDILDDIVIGRGSEADMDLEPYRGYEHAVSRRHAMLRPTFRQLHLIDLGSTNGTLYNSIPLGRCATYALKSNDIITLGLQSFTIKIVDGPLVVLA